MSGESTGASPGFDPGIRPLQRAGFARGPGLHDAHPKPDVNRTFRSILLGVLLQLVPARAAQTPPAPSPSDLEALLNEGQRWWEQHIDEEALPPLPELDLQQVEPLLRRVQDRLQAENLLDLAELRRVAEALLPWLERETALQPYVPWLRARLDYFKAAETFALASPPPPGVPTPAVPGSPLRPRRPVQPPSAPPAVSPLQPKSSMGPVLPVTRPAWVPSAAQQRKVWSDITIVEPWPDQARRRVPQLKPIFREEGVPEELVWVAEVESSFDPGARSPAGAAGLYQLMPETARAQGLSTFPFDQRYRPEKNARASARYLRALHRRFKDWPLALAAYNAGETRVANLLSRHRARTFHDIARHLPAETQMYVPRIDALLQRREGRSLARLPSPTR